jgi:hypothetical protein
MSILRNNSAKSIDAKSRKIIENKYAKMMRCLL